MSITRAQFWLSEFLLDHTLTKGVPTNLYAILGIFLIAVSADALVPATLSWMGTLAIGLLAGGRIVWVYSKAKGGFSGGRADNACLLTDRRDAA